VLRVSDVVSVHATLAPETRGLLNGARLALMKRTAYRISTARGPIVEESALIAALSTRRIAGAALDVFDREPLPKEHPLTKLSNVILTPHPGWSTEKMCEQFADAAAEVLFAYLEGRDFPRFVDGH
jgi:phosphoglycerate dehydrogenase-like enzyme